jgi:hypothetical protein
MRYLVSRCPEVGLGDCGAIRLSDRFPVRIALTGMIADGEITPAEAPEIAHMVLRGNTSKLCGWPRRDDGQFS